MAELILRGRLVRRLRIESIQELRVPFCEVLRGPTDWCPRTAECGWPAEYYNLNPDPDPATPLTRGVLRIGLRIGPRPIGKTRAIIGILSVDSEARRQTHNSMLRISVRNTESNNI